MEATHQKWPHRYFSNLITRLLLLVLTLMMISCGGSKTIQKTPKFRYAGTTLSKSVSVSGNLGIPTTATNRFSAKDKAVYAHLKLENLSGNHKVRWEWYGPDKKLYYTTGNTRVKASTGKYTKQLTA